MCPMKWADPPSPVRNVSGRPPLYDPADLDALRSNPGKWALIASYAVSVDASGHRSSGAQPAARRLRARGFETTVRDAGDLYARWPA